MYCISLATDVTMAEVDNHEVVLRVKVLLHRLHLLTFGYLLEMTRFSI